MKAYRGVEVQLHSFLTSALDDGEWTTTRLGRCTPGGRNPVPIEQETRREEVRARAGVDVSEKRKKTAGNLIANLLVRNPSDYTENVVPLDDRPQDVSQ
jgi:hypothetical protein